MDDGKWEDNMYLNFIMNLIHLKRETTGESIFGDVLPVIRKIEIDYLTECKLGDQLEVIHFSIDKR